MQAARTKPRLRILPVHGCPRGLPLPLVMALRSLVLPPLPPLVVGPHAHLGV